MAASSILRLSACFLLLLVFLSGFEAQTYPTTPYYLSTQQYPATTTQQPNSYSKYFCHLPIGYQPKRLDPETLNIRVVCQLLSTEICWLVPRWRMALPLVI